jgi:hypothetical protein
MTFASIRAAAQEAAKRGSLTPHQLAALQALDEALTDEQRQLFTDAWRAQGSPAAPAPAANPYAALRPLLDVIAEGEGDYTSANRGHAGDMPGGWPELDRLTIREVQALQQRGELFAVGRYQFIPETLRMAVAAAGFLPSDVFTPETQDWLAVALLLGGKRPALRDYLQGEAVTIEAAQLELAKEWASIPKADGRGVYDGDSAGNRATGDVARVQAALEAARRGLAGKTLPQLRLPAQQTSKPTGPVAPVSSRPHLRLTRSGARDARGLDLLRLHYIKAGRLVGELLVVSGAPGAQEFRTGARSRAGSLEPLPEGRYGISDIAWAGGRDNYAASWGVGLGPASVPLVYLGPGKTERSAIEIHYDANAARSPGTAGCVGVRSIGDLRTLVGWLRDSDPRDLFVDWGLGTCPVVKA